LSTQKPVAQVAVSANRTESETNEHVLPRASSDSLWFQFWYLGILRLFLGVAQIVVVVWCFALLVLHGINPHTMRVAFIGVGITSLSLLLFRIIKRGK
jgi:hypothetical protein